VESRSQIASACSIALLSVAAGLFPLEFLRQSCRSGGLATCHFGWPRGAARRLRRNVRWLAAIGLPLMFFITLLHAHDPEPGRFAIERMCFIVSMCLLAFFGLRVLRPSGGVLRELTAYQRGGWVNRLRYLWPTLAVLLPLSLGVLAATGYYYTAQQLAWRVYQSSWMLLGLLFLREFLLRWLLVRRRKLSIRQARERRAASAEEQAALGESSLPVKPSPEEAAADLAAISSQARRVVSTGLAVTLLAGLWLVWVDILPALNALDRWTLWWHVTTEIVDATSSAEPATGFPLNPMGGAVQGTLPGRDGESGNVRTVVRPITAADLAIAVLVSVLTLIAARNVPGLLEMSLLPRLPLDASVRYAVTRIVSYLIVLAGAVASCNSIGLGWSKIQWLATALTFGLAFGLQEIFANFVSGLIILFERPVRVGDVVTVDDVTGVVSRVRIRATTITNWDRKEFVVPNKEFITGRILNWTLSDSTNRVVINVGVAYGSDTELARELLQKIAREHPLVLDDPPPVATFESFGESSLNFVLRAFLPALDSRLTVVHELHTAINKAFEEHGIQIAFPQHDLHIRSMPEGWKNAVRPALEPVVPFGNGAKHA
jgi:potassium efflux system protein